MSDAKMDALALLREAAKAQPQQPLLVLVGGPPGSGKSVVAGALAEAAGIVALHKDAFKEPLMTVFGVQSVEDSTAASAAAVASLFAAADAVLERQLDLVVESTLTRDDVGRIGSFQRARGCALLQVHVSAAIDVLAQRWEQRVGRRHPGHLDAERLPELRARVEAGTWDALTLDAVLLRIDTSAGAGFDATAWLARLTQEQSAAARR